jgi:hypothetical protein
VRVDAFRGVDPSPPPHAPLAHQAEGTVVVAAPLLLKGGADTSADDDNNDKPMDRVSEEEEGGVSGGVTGHGLVFSLDESTDVRWYLEEKYLRVAWNQSHFPDLTY